MRTTELATMPWMKLKYVPASFDNFNINIGFIIVMLVTNQRDCIAGDGHQLGYNIHKNCQGQQYSHSCNGK